MGYTQEIRVEMRVSKGGSEDTNQVQLECRKCQQHRGAVE